MDTSSLALLVLLTALSCNAHWEREWEDWKARFNRKYVTFKEEALAHEVWGQNMAFIQSHNSRPDVTFSVGMNDFGDKKWGERPRSILKVVSSDNIQKTIVMEDAPPPTSWDWRKKGVITPVENQGQMGQSDAIAVTEDLESLHAIKTKQLVRLSSQEVVDCCSVTPGMLKAAIYECIAKLGGLCSEAAYPPDPSSQQCKSSQCTPIAKDANKTAHIPKGNENQMVTAVLTVPLVVYIDASHTSFQLYQGGIYSDPDCSQVSVDHAMQLVGYGTQRGINYWILKNSWGTWAWLVLMCSVDDNHELKIPGRGVDGVLDLCGVYTAGVCHRLEIGRSVVARSESQVTY